MCAIYVCVILFTAPSPIQPPELPDGWVSIQHASGACVYFHRESRVCSWAMPYTIKKGTTVKVRCTCIQLVFNVAILVELRVEFHPLTALN